MASVGANLESFFEEQLKLLYPNRTLPGVKEEGVALAASEETSSPSSKTPQDTSQAEDTEEPSNENVPQQELPTKDTEGKPENLPAELSPVNTNTDSKVTDDPEGWSLFSILYRLDKENLWLMAIIILYYYYCFRYRKCTPLKL